MEQCFFVNLQSKEVIPGSVCMCFYDIVADNYHNTDFGDGWPRHVEVCANEAEL